MPIEYRPSAFSVVGSGGFGTDRGSGGALPLNGRIAARKQLTDDLVILDIDLDGWEFPAFVPGQYADLALQVERTVQEVLALSSMSDGTAEMIKRSYSIASSSDDRKHLQFLLNLVHGGEFTPSLWRMNEGDRVYVEPCPRGYFTLENVPVESDVIFVATGTGVAPFMSKLRTFAAKKRWRRAVLVHAVRYERDLAFREELAALDRSNENFSYLPTVTRDGKNGGWKGLRIRPQEVLQREDFPTLSGGIDVHPSGDNLHLFFCGNPDMVRDAVARYEAAGFVRQTANRPGTLHMESYW